MIECEKGRTKVDNTNHDRWYTLITDIIQYATVHDEATITTKGKGANNIPWDPQRT